AWSLLSALGARHSHITVRRVGAGVDTPAALDDDLVQVGVVGAAAGAAFAAEVLHAEGVILEVERDDIGVGWHGVDALLAPRAEQRQRLRLVQLVDVPARDRAGGHDVAPVDHDRVARRAADFAVGDHILVEVDPHPGVVGLGVELAYHTLAR